MQSNLAGHGYPDTQALCKTQRALIVRSFLRETVLTNAFRSKPSVQTCAPTQDNATPSRLAFCHHTTGHASRTHH
eukprot:4551159-Amphidinium_carterae.1